MINHTVLLIMQFEASCSCKISSCVNSFKLCVISNAWNQNTWTLLAGTKYHYQNNTLSPTGISISSTLSH